MTRERRCIELGPLEGVAGSDPAGQVGWRRTIRRANGVEERWRVGELIHIRQESTTIEEQQYGERVTKTYSYTTVPARVDFSVILAATTVETDDWTQAPWDHMDGWEHREITDVEGDWIKKARGRTPDGYIVLRPQCLDGIYSYHRCLGASKQVAAECVAAQARKTIDTIAEWYRNGWWWYGVSCEYRGYTSSIWGLLEDAGPHVELLRVEIADEVAHQMSQDGYVIYYEPSYWEDGAQRLRRGKLQRLKYQLHLFDWAHED